MALSKDKAARRRQLANLKRAPAAPKGNRRAEIHGADARSGPLGLGEARADLYEQLSAAAPVREADGSLPAHDSAMVEVAARALARYRQIDRWIDQQEDFGDETVARAFGLLNAASKTLAELLDRLGMSPRSRAALGLDLKRAQHLDLASYWAEQEGGDA